MSGGPVSGRYGVAGFGRTAASLINLVLLIVPLMGLTIGAGALSSERERGTLEALLSQPLHRSEILLAKFLGLGLALLGALAIGFGAAATLMGVQGRAANAGQYFAIFAASVGLAWAMLSVGLLISAFARRTTLSLGVAIFAWLAFVFIGDLGLLGSTIALNLTVQELLAVTLCNPLQVFKLLAVGNLSASLDLLGPVGLFATQTYGRYLPLLFGAALLAWIVVPLLLAGLRFARGGAR